MVFPNDLDISYFLIVSVASAPYLRFLAPYVSMFEKPRHIQLQVLSFVFTFPPLLWSSVTPLYFGPSGAPLVLFHRFFCIPAFRRPATFLPFRRSFSALLALLPLSGFPMLRFVFALIAPLWRTFGAIFASTFFLDLLLHSRSRLNLRLRSSCLLVVHLSLYWSYVRCTPTSLSPFCT